MKFFLILSYRITLVFIASYIDISFALAEPHVTLVSGWNSCQVTCSGVQRVIPSRSMNAWCLNLNRCANSSLCFDNQVLAQTQCALINQNVLIENKMDEK